MDVMINGERVTFQYWGQAVRALVAEFGIEVLKIPDYCATMRPYHRNILHVGESLVRGSNRPFATLGTMDSATVLPFEEDVSGKFPDLVFIIPHGYITGNFLPGWVDILDGITAQEGSSNFLEFQDSTHYRVRGLERNHLVIMMNYFMVKSVPCIITLTAELTVTEG